MISGTPATAGDSVVSITVTDSSTPVLKGTATFNLKITAAQPASITVVDGSSQSAAINTAFANPLRVVVKDSSAKPVAGVQVTFSAPGSGASGTFAGGQSVATTDASGIATSPVFTANSTAGAYSVTASTGSLSTSFSLTNLTGTPAISVVSGSGQSAQINTAFALPLKVQVKDQGNNPISNSTVTFTSTRKRRQCDICRGSEHGQDGRLRLRYVCNPDREWHSRAVQRRRYRRRCECHFQSHELPRAPRVR